MLWNHSLTNALTIHWNVNVERWKLKVAKNFFWVFKESYLVENINFVSLPENDIKFAWIQSCSVHPVDNPEKIKAEQPSFRDLKFFSASQKWKTYEEALILTRIEENTKIW